MNFQWDNRNIFIFDANCSRKNFWKFSHEFSSQFSHHKFSTYFSFPDPDPAGLRLLNAFNHLVFIDDDDDVDILRSPGLGEPGSSLDRKSSFWKRQKRKKNSLDRFFGEDMIHKLCIHVMLKFRNFIAIYDQKRKIYAQKRFYFLSDKNKSKIKKQKSKRKDKFVRPSADELWNLIKQIWMVRRIHEGKSGTRNAMNEKPRKNLRSFLREKSFFTYSARRMTEIKSKTRFIG